MSLLALQLLNGVQCGLLLFLAASGLTLIFGILGVINLAHGAFYMLGAYLAASLVAHVGDLFLGLLIGVPLAFVLGLAVEWLFIRHLYGRDHLQQVLLTYALILVVNEAQQVIWGSKPLSIGAPGWLSGSVQLTDALAYPLYRVALMIACLLLAAVMVLLIGRTQAGRLVRAAEANREMVELLGFDTPKLFRLVFAAGVTLAATAGMLAAPLESAYPGLGDRVLIVSFVVVVIGGIGSVRGAFVGALLIGLTDAFGKVLIPSFSSVLIYALMFAVLVIRPAGLFGRA